MKVLVIPSWYPDGEDKLMGIYHKEFCQALSKKADVDMLYISRQRINAPLKYIFMKKDEIVCEDGYKVYIKKMLNVSKISEDYQIKMYCKKLEKLYLEYIKDHEKPDVIHAQVTIPAGYAACILGKKYNIPVVVTEHASYFQRFFEGKNKKYGEYVLKNNKFTTVSNYMAKIIKDLGYECEVIPNLVAVKDFMLPKEEVKGLKLVTVSALRQGKNIDDIIEALKLIREKHKTEASLTIIGDGFLEDYYKNRCKELNMDKYVNFVGRKNKNEIANILGEHNIFVIASEKETFCIPGVEALARGLPVVATKCLGPEEYIDQKCGKLVDVKDIEGLSKAILDVYQNIDKYSVEYLRSVALKYGDDAVVNKALKIYNSK